jgi:hypothetical protein
MNLPLRELNFIRIIRVTLNIPNKGLQQTLNHKIGDLPFKLNGIGSIILLILFVDYHLQPPEYLLAILSEPSDVQYLFQPPFVLTSVLLHFVFVSTTLVDLCSLIYIIYLNYNPCQL